MKVLLSIICFALMFSVRGQTSISASDKDYQPISEMLTRKSIALINLDTVFLDQLTDPGFVYINSRGKTLDKASYLSAISKGKIKFISQSAEITSIVKTGKTYYLTAILKDKFIYEGKSVTATYNTVNIFVRKGKNFRWVYGQSTEIVN